MPDTPAPPNKSNGHVNIDEETPLLRDDANAQPTAGVTAAEESDCNSEDREHTVIVGEPSNSKLVVVLGSVYVGVFLGALDVTVIATLSAPISTSFNSLNLLSWVATAYLIANAACQPISGRLTDIFSRRWGLVLSNILFAIGNLMCGLAQTPWMMIAGRVVAGMGGGGLMAISTFVASDLVPLRKRGIVQGIGNLAFGSGSGLGGLFGGWVHDNWGWRWAFYSQVPFVILSAILVFFTVDIPPKYSARSRLSRVDFVGVFTLVVFLVLLLLGLNSGGNIVPWTHPLVLTTLPLSALTMLFFIYYEAYRAKDPVIPVRLLLDQTVASACLTNWFTTGSMFLLLFYIPIYFQISGLSTTQAGSRLIPQAVGVSLGSLGSGILMNKTGKYKIQGLVIMAIFVAGAVLVSTMDFNTPPTPPFGYIFLLGTGYGGMLTVTLLAVIAAIPHEHQAVITSATYAFRSTGSTIGITIASAVYQNILNSELFSRFGDQPGAAEEIGRIRDDLDELKFLPPGWRDGVLDSYLSALRGVFITGLIAAVFGLVSFLFVREHELHETLERSRVRIRTGAPGPDDEECSGANGENGNESV